MAKIQKETVIITFSKLVKDDDTVTGLLLPDSVVNELRDHAQNMVHDDIIVESKLETLEESFDNWDTTTSDVDFYQPAETVVEESSVATVDEAPAEDDNRNQNGF